MRPFFFATLNRLVGNKPGVTAAALVAPARVRPARNIAFVLVRDAKRKPVDVDLAVQREVKNVLVAIVQKSFRADRLEVSECALVNRDRFDPVNRILQNEQIAELENNFVRQHWL